MAAYDEVRYQLGDKHPDAYCCGREVCDYHAALGAAFRAGVADERARITEELALSTDFVQLLLVNGEWERRVSLHKWRTGGIRERAQELRAAARELLQEHDRWF